MPESNQLIDLLRTAGLDAETVEKVGAILKKEAATVAAVAERAVNAEKQAAGFEASLTASTDEIAALRSIVQDAMAAVTESRSQIEVLTTKVGSMEELRGSMPSSSALRGSRQGSGSEETPLASAEEMAAIETDNTSILRTWGKICNGYKARYGDFSPRFAPEGAGNAPSFVAGLQARILPGERPHFVDTTRSNSPAYAG